MLWSYYTTPNVSTGHSPFELLRGRKAGSKLSPGWLCKDKEVEINSEEVRRKVEIKQKYKEMYDKKWGTKNKPLKQGEWVLVRKPYGVGRKGEKFYAPEKIKEVKSNVVILESGKMWSMDRIVQCPDKLRPSVEGCPSNSNAQGVGVQGKRDERSRQPPGWHRYYKML